MIIDRMKISFLMGLIFLLVIQYPNLVLAQGTKTYHIYNTISSENERNKFKGFLTNVLKQISIKDFGQISDSIIKHQSAPISDDVFYEEFRQRFAPIRGILFPLTQLDALKSQQQALGDFTKELVGDQKLNGIVEIGTPGAYINPLKARLNIKGTSYVIYDDEKVFDYAQNFSFRPLSKFRSYDVFIPSNNFAPISEKDIPTASVDIVVCYTGLHHLKAEELDPFLDSINRILRPGGIFIYRDHDVQNAVVMDQVHTAHSIFNAVTLNLPLNDEQAEQRDLFMPIDKWESIIESHGFKHQGERKLQAGDSTMNTSAKYIKIHDVPQPYVVRERKLLNSFMTVPEWYNVEIAQEYGRFIEHTPFYNFPYIKSIGLYWKLFKDSYTAARKHASFREIFFSSYMLMDLFVGVTMTIEYSLKSFISILPRMIYDDTIDTDIDLIISSSDLAALTSVDSRIKVQKQEKNLVYITLPRYKEFTEIVNKLANADMQFVSIAGNDLVHIKISGDITELNKQCVDQTVCSLDYTWELPTVKDKKFATFTVSINKLTQFIKRLEERKLNLAYIYDF